MKVTTPVFAPPATYINKIDKAPFEHKIETNAPSNVKKGVFITTLIGTLTALGLIMKRKGYSFNPKTIMKTAPKDWGLWKAEYKEGAILGLATGSVGGGLIGGAIFDDKKHMKAKLRESVIQMIGNITIPILCVSGGVRAFKFFEKKAALTNKFLNGTIKVAATLASLGVGIILGNKTGNMINEKIFKVKDDRHVKPADFSAHIDDMCLAISLATMGDKPEVVGAPPSGVGHAISRVIPAALMVAGYSTGTMQEKHLK